MLTLNGELCWKNLSKEAAVLEWNSSLMSYENPQLCELADNALDFIDLVLILQIKSAFLYFWPFRLGIYSYLLELTLAPDNISFAV